MPNSSQSIVEFVLLGPTNDRRQLQDSPILGDVWIEFAKKPAMAVDLLITPDRERPAGPVAVRIAQVIAQMNLEREKGQEAHVAYLQGIVAARLFFKEVLRIMPLTRWWRDRNVQEKLQDYVKKPESLRQRIQAIITWAHAKNKDIQDECAEAFADFSALDRYVTLAGIILWAGLQGKKADSPEGGIGAIIGEIQRPDALIKELRQLFTEILKEPQVKEPQIYQVSLNRRAVPALERSVPAVKGDAARTLFKVKCDKIAWAVLDSGIDANHDAFRDKDGNSRVVKAFDFSNIRKIVNLDNLNTQSPAFAQRLEDLRAGREKNLDKKEAAAILKKLAENASNDRPVYWDLVEKFITIDPLDPKNEPRSSHGTHVAGILGSSGECAGRASKGKGGAKDSGMSASRNVDGMCPDIKLYDFRVLGQSIQDTEFAIIAALQYIRYLNDLHSYISIHGANLSLSVPHDVRNFACGQTPICIESERLVESGVVVVAAAGNLGYQTFETSSGSYEGYTAFSITDPGNADSVITVGATHRYRPHTYGVSFFSSRGPTGDGRMKPDLVAPGERIESSLPNQDWGELDGTSMAAPHVSGAAAMLMARNSELIGEPQSIKRILCESATDLGRERTFQGHGMLDVLRAFQQI
jgi:serine protease AprX